MDFAKIARSLQEMIVIRLICLLRETQDFHGTQNWNLRGFQLRSNYMRVQDLCRSMRILIAMFERSVC